MPDQFSDEWTRVRDKQTGHEYTVAATAVDEDVHTVVDKPALDPSGVPLDPKPRVPKGGAVNKNDDGPTATKEK